MVLPGCLLQAAAFLQAQPEELPWPVPWATCQASLRSCSLSCCCTPCHNLMPDMRASQDQSNLHTWTVPNWLK